MCGQVVKRHALVLVLHPARQRLRNHNGWRQQKSRIAPVQASEPARPDSSRFLPCPIPNADSRAMGGAHPRPASSTPAAAESRRLASEKEQNRTGSSQRIGETGHLSARPCTIPDADSCVIGRARPRPASHPNRTGWRQHKTQSHRFASVGQRNRLFY